jgi:hypothetical protein
MSCESLEPKDDLPQNFYIYALDLVRKKLISSNKPEFQDIGLTRKIIKRSVMTIPYNISLSGIGEQLMDHFTKV